MTLSLHIKNMAGDIHSLTLDVPVRSLRCIRQALYHHDPVTYPLLTTFLFRLPREEEEEQAEAEMEAEMDKEEKEEDPEHACIMDDDVLCVFYREIVVNQVASKGRRYQFELPVGHSETPVRFYCDIVRWDLFNGSTFFVRYFSDEKMVSENNKSLYTTILSVFPSVSPHEWMAIQRIVFTAVDGFLEEHGYRTKVEGHYIHDNYAVNDQPFVCECGSVIQYRSQYAHRNTKKHKAFLQK